MSTQNCPICGMKNDAQAERCTNCGHLFQGTSKLPESKPALNLRPKFPIDIRKHRRWLLIGIIFLILLSFIPWIPRIINLPPFGMKSTATPTSQNPLGYPLGVGANGIGVRYVDGEYIGISDGRFALDTRDDRMGRDFMVEAAAKLRAGDSSAATSLWNEAVNLDSNNAEPLIYIEDQRVLASGSPYITFVVGVLLGTNVFDGFSRDALQAAYVAQKDYNDQHKLPGGMQVRLLIAKSGSTPLNSKEIAQQVVQAAKFDKTIVGVMGWPTSITALDTIPILANNHIPMVGSGVTSDALTNYSPYFFRTSPPNKELVQLLVKDVETHLHPMRLVTFKDPADTYSQNTETDFVSQFTKDGYGNNIVYRQNINRDISSRDLSTEVRNIVNKYHPDVILFTPNIVDQMFALMSATPPSIQVVMGVAGYEVIESNQHVNGYNRLRFPSGAFADEWLGQSNKPSFFDEYIAAFDPNGEHTSNPYSYDRPNSIVMLGYDAMSVLLEASSMALAGKNGTFTPGQQSITPEDLENALKQFHGSQAIQGITGVISFGTDGDPINKKLFVLRVDQNNHLQIDAAQNCLLKAQCNA